MKTQDMELKLKDIILLSLSIGFLIIGIHQVIVRGLGDAYGALMLSLILFFLYLYRKRG